MAALIHPESILCPQYTSSVGDVADRFVVSINHLAQYSTKELEARFASIEFLFHSVSCALKTTLCLIIFHLYQTTKSLEANTNIKVFYKETCHRLSKGSMAEGYATDLISPSR